MGKLFFITGLISLVTSLFLSGELLKKFGWKVSARISPIAIGISGVIFFLMSYFRAYLDPLATLLGTSTLLLIVFFGAFQSIISKTAKYAFFDPTKEIAYIPLDEESKIKGKAAIDMVGSRVGKSGSSWLLIFFVGQTATGSIQSCSEVLLVSLVIATYLWYRSTQYINSTLEDDGI